MQIQICSKFADSLSDMIEVGESVFLVWSRVFVIAIINPRLFGHGSSWEEWTEMQLRYKQEAGINKVTCVMQPCLCFVLHVCDYIKLDASVVSGSCRYCTHKDSFSFE